MTTAICRDSTWVAFLAVTAITTNLGWASDELTTNNVTQTAYDSTASRDQNSSSPSPLYVTATWAVDLEEFNFTSYPNGTADAGNATTGTNPWQAWQAALIATGCGLIVIGTIVGNVLVCTAVGIVRKLRTPSNLLIVSLAVSDLLVAIVDMPFAIAYEVMGTWVLGETVCDAWTSLDVLLCTSSILNLCAISIDRYFVITRPFQYAMKRTPARMAIMIAIVWALSAVISIPPLIGWKRKGPTDPGQCLVSQDIGYQVYATIGAFYLPLTVMIIIYVRIYLVSSRIARAEALSKPSFDASCLTSQPSASIVASSSSRLLQPASQRSLHQQSRYSLTTTGSETPGELKDSAVMSTRPSTEDVLQVQSAITNWHKSPSTKSAVVDGSTVGYLQSTTGTADNTPVVELVIDVSPAVEFVSGPDDEDADNNDSSVVNGSRVTNNDLSQFHHHGNGNGGGNNSEGFVTRNGNICNGNAGNNHFRLQPVPAASSSRRNRTFSFVDLLPIRRSTLPAASDHMRFRPFLKSVSSSSAPPRPVPSPSCQATTTSRRRSSAPPRRSSRMSASNERKATKTLGVIMGAFTACWLPFFILALVRPFCHEQTDCVPNWLNGLFLWLGYANSLLNPIIYARFNRDFRTPFRHILQCHVRDINVRLRSDNYTEQFGGGAVTPGARSNSVACPDWLLHHPRGSTTSADALMRCSVNPQGRSHQASDPM